MDPDQTFTDRPATSVTQLLLNQSDVKLCVCVAQVSSGAVWGLQCQRHELQPPGSTARHQKEGTRIKHSHVQSEFIRCFLCLIDF